MKRINDREVVVGPVRLSYMNVFTPKVNDLKEGAKEYSAVLLIPKQGNEFLPNAAEELKELRKALSGAVFAKWGDKPPAKLRNPIRDGDEETDSQGEPKAPGYWFMNVSAKEAYPPPSRGWITPDGHRRMELRRLGDGAYRHLRLRTKGKPRRVGWSSSYPVPPQGREHGRKRREC